MKQLPLSLIIFISLLTFSCQEDKVKQMEDSIANTSYEIKPVNRPNNSENPNSESGITKDSNLNKNQSNEQDLMDSESKAETPKPIKEESKSKSEKIKKSEPQKEKLNIENAVKDDFSGNYTTRQVAQVAIYPGCERFKGDKPKLQKCLSDKLTGELQDQLSDFAEKMSNSNERRAVAKVSFVIDKSGKISAVKAMKGNGREIDELLGIEAEKALQRIAQRLVSRNKMIEPAKLDDGSAVNMSFTLPIAFNIQ